MIYVIHAIGTDRYKIGFTTDIRTRFNDLQGASPYPLKLLFFANGTMAEERYFHQLHKAQRVHGEWFTFFPLEITILRKHFIEKCGPLLSYKPAQFNQSWRARKGLKPIARHIPDPEFQNKKQEDIFKLYKSGLSLRKISEILKQQAIDAGEKTRGYTHTQVKNDLLKLGVY